MAREKFIDPDYRREPRTATYCCRCQKDLQDGTFTWIYLREDGVTAVHPADVAAGQKIPTDIGWLRIGNECCKIVGKEWTVQWKP